MSVILFCVHSKFLSDKKPSVGQLVIKSGVNLQI